MAMKRISNKRKRLMEAVASFRKNLTEKVGKCEICGASPSRPRNRAMPQLSRLCVHEIANGPDRSKALDKPFAVLVTCWQCNSSVVIHKGNWPQARQLAVLMASRPHDYDLTEFNSLVNPNAPRRICQEEVNSWIESIK